MLSRYCSDIANKYGIKVGGVKKLIPNLINKVKYVVHYRNLQYYLSLGIKVVKVHRTLKFQQSNWLKEYVQFNTKKRQESIDEFNKIFLKLLMNCIYGKSMENIGKRINVRLINDSKEHLKCVTKPNFISQKIFDKNFAIHCVKTVLTLNKPLYLGFCILELSKLFMYKFHFDYACKTFDAKLLFTETDSLVYEIKSDNVYGQCFRDKDLFDFSGYPKNTVYYDISNKKKLGKIKDEFNGNKIVEFVRLKSKMYSLISSDDKEVNKAKGINKRLKHKEYHDAFFIKKVVRYKAVLIMKDVLDDGINVLAYFPKDIVG